MWKEKNNNKRWIFAWIEKNPFFEDYVIEKFNLIKSEKIVKCFNSTGFENMINPVYNGNGIDMFCVGNSKEAKDLASSLAKEIGFANCWDFGGDDKVELLENLH